MTSTRNRARPGFRHRPGPAIGLCLVIGLLAPGCGKKEETAKEEKPPANAGVPSVPVLPKGKSSLVSLHGEMHVLPGMKVKSEQSLELKDGVIVTESGGKTVRGRMTVTDRERRQVEYVSDKEKHVVLEEKQLIIHREMAGEEAVDTDVRSVLEGRKLTALRRKDGHWWFGLAEGEADAEAVNELVDLGKREMLEIGAYPEEARAVGDSWESSLEALTALLGAQFQATSGTATMTLERLSSYEGQRCAEIGVALTCEGTYDAGGSPLGMKLELKGAILRSLNTFQDLRITLDGPITLNAAPGEGATVSIEGTVHFLLENHVTRE